MIAMEQLSDLERGRVTTEAYETLTKIFSAVHEATGWCGDIDQKPWEVGLPIMEDTLARLMIRTR